MLPKDAFERRAGSRFLDVREPHEYAAGHIPGAVHIPLMSLKERMSELDREQTWIVSCQIGQRSDLATRFLRVQGFEAHNLDGGLERWAAEGLPLTTDGEQGRVIDGEGRIIEWLPDS